MMALVPPHRLVMNYHMLTPIALCTPSDGAPERMRQLQELMVLIINVLKIMDPWTLQQMRQGAPLVRATPPAVHQLREIMQLVPQELKPLVAMMIPVLLDPSEHTVAAGVLLSALAEAGRAGQECEAELQLPVCTALGMLQIEATVAATALQETLAVLPNLPMGEVPAAIALIMKLANDAVAPVQATVRAVRKVVNRMGSEVSLAVLQVMCLVVVQHHEVAAAMLRDIMDDWNVPAAGAEEGGGCAPPCSAPPAGESRIVDAEMLLEIMLIPHLRHDAERIFEACVARGLITEAETAAVLERRRMQQIMFHALLSQMSASDAMHSRAAHPQAASWWQHFAAVLGMRSMPQTPAAPPAPAGYPQDGQQPAPASAHPPAFLPPPPPAAQPPAVWPNGQPAYCGRFPPTDVFETDDFEVLLNLAAWLSHSKSPTVQQYTYQLYIRIFVMWPCQEERVRVIHNLVHRATGFAIMMPPSLDQRLVPLMPVTPGACENRVLLTIVKDYAQYSGVAFIYLMDLLCRHSATSSALAMQHQASVEEVARVAAELAAARAAAAAEKKALKAKITELEAAAKRKAADAKKEVKALADSNTELLVQVQQLEKEIEWVRQECEEACSKGSAAERDLRLLDSNSRELAEEVKRLKQQQKDAQKRRQKEAKDLKDLTARLKATEARLADSEAALDTARTVAAKVGPLESNVAELTQALEEARGVGSASDERAAKAEARCAQLEARIKEQEGLIQRLEEEKLSAKRTGPLLLHHMEDDLEGPLHDSITKAAEAVLSDDPPTSPPQQQPGALPVRQQQHTSSTFLSAHVASDPSSPSTNRGTFGGGNFELGRLGTLMSSRASYSHQLDDSARLDSAVQPPPPPPQQPSHQKHSGLGLSAAAFSAFQPAQPAQQPLQPQRQPQHTKYHADPMVQLSSHVSNGSAVGALHSGSQSSMGGMMPTSMSSTLQMAMDRSSQDPIQQSRAANKLSGLGTNPAAKPFVNFKAKGAQPPQPAAAFAQPSDMHSNGRAESSTPRSQAASQQSSMSRNAVPPAGVSQQGGVGLPGMMQQGPTMQTSLSGQPGMTQHAGMASPALQQSSMLPPGMSQRLLQMGGLGQIGQSMSAQGSLQGGALHAGMAQPGVGQLRLTQNSSHMGDSQMPFLMHSLYGNMQSLGFGSDALVNNNTQPSRSMPGNNALGIANLPADLMSMDGPSSNMGPPGMAGASRMLSGSAGGPGQMGVGMNGGGGSGQGPTASAGPPAIPFLSMMSAQGPNSKQNIWGTPSAKRY